MFQLLQLTHFLVLFLSPVQLFQLGLSADNITIKTIL